MKCSNFYKAFLLLAASGALASLATSTWKTFEMRIVFDLVLEPRVLFLLPVGFMSSVMVFVMALCCELASIKRDSLKKLVYFFLSVAAILNFAYASYITNKVGEMQSTETKVNKILRDSILRYEDSDLHRKLWDFVQSELACCGVDAHHDGPETQVSKPCNIQTEYLSLINACSSEIRGRLNRLWIVAAGKCVVGCLVSLLKLFVKLFYYWFTTGQLLEGLFKVSHTLVAITVPKINEIQQQTTPSADFL